jgi:hypothetical protein
MFSLSNRPRTSARTARRTALNVEQLEGRDLMSAQPVLFSTLSELPFSDLSNTPVTAQIRTYLPTLSTAALMESRVQGRLSTGADVDVVKLQLQKGQIFTVDTDFSTFGARVYGAAPKLTLYNSAGQSLIQGGNLGIGYRIVDTGTYYLGIAATSRFTDPATFGANYTLHVRPIGLASNDLDPSWLGRTEGGIYVWQDGDHINISGPTGHGFSVAGAWQKTTSGTAGAISSTYTVANNLVHIKTDIGDISLDGMSLTTAPGKFGDLYGELQSSSFVATSQIIENLARLFGDETPFDMQLNPDNLPFTVGEIGLRLGKDPLLQATGAPVNAAVPYFYINAAAGVNASSNGSFAGLTYQIGALVLDPGDPFLYVGSNVYGYGVGLSRNGLIPFTPEKDPSQFQGKLFGHVYLAGEFRLPTPLPFSVSGDIVINLNGHGTGPVSAETASSLGSISNALTSLGDDGPSTDAGTETDGGTSTGGSSGSVLPGRNFSIGINGNFNFLLPVQELVDQQLATNPGTKWFEEHPNTSLATEYVWNWLPEDLSLALASASAIYDGPNGALYFRGGTNNYLEDTPLEFLSTGATQLDVDGAWMEGGKFFLDAEGSFGTLGAPITGRVTLARKFDLPPELASLIKGQAVSGTAPVTTTGGYLELGVNVLGSGVTLKGHVNSNGDFSLTGTAGINLGIASSSQTVTLSYSQAEGVRFSTMVTGTVPITSTVRAKVTVQVELGLNGSGPLSYSGTGTATLQVKTPHVSWSGVSWSWDDAVSVSIGVSNDGFWFTGLGYDIDVDWPI